VRVTLTTDGAWVKLSVRDQGPGIPPEEQTELFGLFHKTSVLPTAGERSTGLGLAIARKGVEAHRGHILLDSVVGEGSCFTFPTGRPRFDPTSDSGRDRPRSRAYVSVP
jgi:signal transduction histidine kinase